MTSDVTLNTALSQQNRTNISQTKLASDFNQFLTLLTTQLQNQDPLSPMDTTEFTNQLVSFSAVEQQININQKLDSLVALGVGNSFTAALSYVGMDANYVSAEFNFDGATPVETKYALNGEAVSAKINVYNEEGDLVYSKVGTTTATNNSFTWDGTMTQGGKAPKGTYEIEIAAFDAQEKQITATTVVKGRVRGIETQNGQIFALIGDRAVALANIINTSLPEEPPVTPLADDEQDV